MSIFKPALKKTILSIATGCVLSTPAMATSTDEEIQALWQTLDSMQEQLSSAEEWKSPNSLIHMAGYADVNYVNTDSDSGNFKTGAFAPIFHYQYRDLVMLESEIAFKVTADGETEVDMEYFTVDFFMGDNAALVMGKFLSPLGQFRQNLHPSWINKLPSAPIGFGHDQASPNSDVGIQVRGGFKLSFADANYAVYTGNGVASELNASGNEIEMIESPGYNVDGDRKKNYGGRFGLFFPSSKVDFGLSWASGKLSEVESGIYTNTRDWDFIGADFTWHLGGLDLRGEYAKQTVGALATSTAPEKADFEAYYAQIAYRFALSKWEIVARTSQYTIPETTMNRTSAGINYIFASNIIAKLAYETNDDDIAPVDDKMLVQLAYGF